VEDSSEQVVGVRIEMNILKQDRAPEDRPKRSKSNRVDAFYICALKLEASIQIIDIILLGKMFRNKSKKLLIQT